MSLREETSRTLEQVVVMTSLGNISASSKWQRA